MNPTPDELMVVYTTDDANVAEIIRVGLHNEGLRCEISDETQGGFSGLTSMEIKVLVRAEDYDRAKKFIERHESTP